MEFKDQFAAVRATTLILVGLAVAILHVAMFRAQAYPWLQAGTLMLVILLAVVCSRLAWTGTGKNRPLAGVSLYLTVLFLIPYGSDFLFRVFFESG